MDGISPFVVRMTEVREFEVTVSSINQELAELAAYDLVSRGLRPDERELGTSELQIAGVRAPS